MSAAAVAEDSGDNGGSGGVLDPSLGFPGGGDEGAEPGHGLDRTVRSVFVSPTVAASAFIELSPVCIARSASVSVAPAPSSKGPFPETTWPESAAAPLGGSLAFIPDLPMGALAVPSRALVFLPVGTDDLLP